MTMVFMEMAKYNFNMTSLNSKIQKFVLNASSKALATIGVNGLNVVPVSTIQIKDGKVWLFDYFMNKTVQNIKSNTKVSLVCWSGLQGFQLKGMASYFDSGTDFEIAREYVKHIHPERRLKGLIILDVKEVFDISVG